MPEKLNSDSSKRELDQFVSELQDKIDQKENDDFSLYALELGRQSYKFWNSASLA